MSQCHAKAKATGQQCARHAIAGATVCRVHGGGAPQVREKARLRLLALVDPAIGALGELVRDKRIPAVRLQASKDILDRAGIREAPETAAGSNVVQIAIVSSEGPEAKPLNIRALVKE
jgi:hypothetical protein